MIKVLVDTTTTFTDVMMTSTRWMQMLTLCEKGEIGLVVPEVVLRETTRHWLKEAQKAVADADERWARIVKTHKSFDHLGLEPKPGALPELPPVVPNAKEFYDKSYARLASLGVDQPGIPGIGVEEILSRDLSGRKPFAESGKGFRDALVWENVKETLVDLGADDVLFFVTKNTDDYCLDGELHPDLQAEIAGAEAELVQVDSLELLVATVAIAPLVALLAKTVEELSKYLASSLVAGDPEYDGPSVGEVVTSALIAGAEGLVGESVTSGDEAGWGPDFSNLYLPSEFEDATISYLEVHEETVDWQTYETFEGGTLLIRGELIADITIDGYVFKSDANFLESEQGVTILEWDYNKHYSNVAVTKKARLIFQVQAVPGSHSVEDCELDGIESLDDLDTEHPWSSK